MARILLPKRKNHEGVFKITEWAESFSRTGYFNVFFRLLLSLSFARFQVRRGQNDVRWELFLLG